jgi:mannose-6-phosphate isomerase
MNLYPLLMAPHFAHRPWGARDLAPIFPRHAHPDEEPIGEAWLTGDQCRVVNGVCGGASLAELCERFGRELVGSAPADGHRFPLLAKFLFPCEKLSVQVHPDDESACRLGLPCGKNECWYIVQAEPDSRIALGLKPGTTCAQFADAIAQQRAEDLLNWLTIRPDEMIYVEAGTVHTMDGGSIILEVQQNSDTTFRLYDYGRPRELHLQQGLEVMKEVTAAGKVPPPAPGNERLIQAPAFAVDKVRVDQSREFRSPAGRTAQVLVAIHGCGAVEAPGASPLAFAQGDTIIIPAALERFSVKPQWDLEFLRAELP